MASNGVAYTAAGIGALLLYSGIRGSGVLPTLAGLVTGKAPSTNPNVNPINSSVGTAGETIAGAIPSAVAAVGGDAKTALKNAAAARGWDTGPQWTALDAIEMQEAGYDPTNTNPSSKAYGLAQSLGHGFTGGPASNGINEYGGEGLTPDQSRAASLGDPTWQAVWMVNYIASRYGTPVVAEQFHLRNNWY